VLDRPLINRDRASGLYAGGAYFGARSLLDLPILIIVPVLFNSILYFMVGLRGTPEAFFTFLGICILNCICAGSLYTLLGSFSPNALVATLLAFIGTVFLMLFAGFFVPLPILPSWWIWMSWISFFRWSFQSLMVNQFAGTAAGDQLLVNYGFSGWSIYNGCLGLIAQIIIFRVLAFVIIRFANKEKR
jgi:ATP-binding cassette subfamily G (WHITE) protein 2